MDGMLSKLELDEWYKLLGVGSALAFVAAISTGRTGWALVALGGLLISTSIWKDHKTYRAVEPAAFATPSMVVSKTIYEISTVGAAMISIGLGLSIWGFTRI